MLRPDPHPALLPLPSYLILIHHFHPHLILSLPGPRSFPSQQSGTQTQCRLALASCLVQYGGANFDSQTGTRVVSTLLGAVNHHYTLLPLTHKHPASSSSCYLPYMPVCTALLQLARQADLQSVLVDELPPHHMLSLLLNIPHLSSRFFSLTLHFIVCHVILRP